jgi:aminoglycoside/choline kinase family phosphotransferase
MNHPLDPKQLHAAGWTRAEPLTGDASVRRYARTWDSDGRTAILVEYPREIRDQLDRDLHVLAWCRHQGLRVPRVLAADTKRGRAVIEDLGTRDAEAMLATLPERDRTSFLRLCLDPLERLARCDPAKLPGWNPPLDRGRLRWELAGFELWYVRHYRSQPPSATLTGWLDDLAAAVARHPVRVCHRDFHLNNLLVRDDGTLGVIDIQDILVGPDTYDAVSLVWERSAFRLVSTDQRERWLGEWAAVTDAAAGWRDRAAVVRLQRGLKVLGTFARFVIAGRGEYRHWLREVADRLIEPLADAGAPQEVRAILLD